MKISVYLFLIFILTGCSSTKWHTFQANNLRTAAVDRPEIRNPEIKWKTNIGIQGYLNNSVINSDAIFVGSSGSEHNKSDSLDGIYSISAATGKINWHFKTLKDACGVAFSKNKIYATGDDGFLRCLNAKNGKELWRIKREKELYSQPLIVNNSVIIGDADGIILIIDKDSGKIIKESKVANSNVRGGLAADKKYIYATFEEGIIACLDTKGTIIWKVQVEFEGEYGKDFNSIYAAPTISGDTLIVPFSRSTYYDTPAIYAYNTTNGALIWRASKNDEDYNGNIRSSVAILNNLIYYGDPYSNELCVLSLKDGKTMDRYEMGASTFPHWSSPVIANNMLYLGRFDGSFNAFDIKNNKLVWQLFLGDHKNTNKPAHKQVTAWESDNGSIYATPSIDKNGTLYIGSGEGWFYAITNKEL
ncbi:PQQ-like beta-propeller repeat protein [Cellulophaga sp. 20_2_10]|uniref:outer membrane protein assembly factor BamB family protein n=1 Tax=Cellulophaga sp. 20_2_10 TaxID=2942476 RepID=UPI00201AA5C1|nr:PQQ-binding-like beta-propeller repeat protein [Cellulophaga sp. 20_2_10]MCL5246252.1 PQQ-like beta-propeller repeat protein [Cellulophaga sp. 20_2_10]